MRRVIAALLFTLLSLSACGITRETADQESDNSFVVSGTIEFLNIETGCWVLVSTDGKRYEPSGEAAAPLWKDKLQATVRVRLLQGVSSVCQTGIPVEVITILETREI
jgi:hypothetical protein